MVVQQLETLPDSSRRGYMFWSDVVVDTISRAKLNGSEVTVLVNTGLSTVGKGAMVKICLEYQWICKLHDTYLGMYACMNLIMYFNVNTVAN